MRVLVTRPAKSASRTCGKLRALGHMPFCLPMFTPEHDPEAARLALQDKALQDKHRAVIAITSAEAARVLQDLPLPDVLRSLPLFCVGEATAAAARQAGFANVVSGPGNGHDLAEVIADRLPDRTGTVLYLAGIPRASTFERELLAHGIRFQTHEIYRMTERQYTPEQFEEKIVQARPDAILFYSRATADAFFRHDVAPIFATQGLAPSFLCLSPHVSDGMASPFRPQTLVAETPDEPALLALLAKCAHKSTPPF